MLSLQLGFFSWEDAAIWTHCVNWANLTVTFLAYCVSYSLPQYARRSCFGANCWIPVGYHFHVVNYMYELTGGTGWNGRARVTFALLWVELLGHGKLEPGGHWQWMALLARRDNGLHKLWCCNNPYKYKWAVDHSNCINID